MFRGPRVGIDTTPVNTPCCTAYKTLPPCWHRRIPMIAASALEATENQVHNSVLPSPPPAPAPKTPDTRAFVLHSQSSPLPFPSPISHLPLCLAHLAPSVGRSPR